MSSDATNSTLEMDQGVTIGQSLDHPGQSFTVELMGEKSRFSLRLRESNVAAFAKATGLALPTKINSAYRDDDALIMCLAPDEWLIIAAPRLVRHFKRSASAIRHRPSALLTCRIATSRSILVAREQRS